MQIVGGIYLIYLGDGILKSLLVRNAAKAIAVIGWKTIHQH